MLGCTSMWLRTWLGLSTTAALALTTACAAPTSEDDGATSGSDALAVAQSEFGSVLREAEELQRRCERENHCAPSTTTIETASLSPLGHATGSRSASSFTLCGALAPLRSLEHPYFFGGASLKGAYVGTLADRGVEVVFDLKKRQAAAFLYHTTGIQNLIGVEAEAHVGYAFGEKENVIDAWSGDFQTATATFEVPHLEIGLGATIFRAPDSSIWGGAVGVGGGLNLIAAPVGVSVGDGEWHAWDAATKAQGASYWFVRYDEKRATDHGKTYAYLELQSTRDLALALLETFGPLGVAPAAQAAALAALDKAGLTIDEACPTKKPAAQLVH